MISDVSIDGVALSTLGVTVVRGSMLRTIPASRAVSVVLAGRHGSVTGGEEQFEDSKLVLPLHMRGGADHAARFDALTGLLSRRRRLDVRQTLGDGSVRQVDAVFRASFEPEHRPGISTAGTVVLDVPGVFWRDVATSDFVSLTGAQLPAPPYTFEVSTLAGSTAPVTDSLLLLNGPATNPRVEDVATGAWVQFDEVLTSTQQLRVDCAGFTARRGTGIGWDLAGSDVTGLVSNGGPGSGSRWLHLTPVMEGVDPRDRRVRVQLSADSYGAETQLSVRARRAWF